MVKIKKLLFLIFINISILTILLILAEKLINNQSSNKLILGRKRYINLRENNPNSLRNYSDLDITNKNFDIKKLNFYSIATNSDGFIESGNPRVENPDYLLFLGGSTTECILVKSQFRFPSLVESQLNNNKDNKFIALNSGVSGNSSIHSLNILINKGLKYNPKYIFIMHNINDLNSLLRMGNYFTENNYSSREGKNNIIFEPTISKLTIEKIKEKIKKLLPNTYNLYLTKKLQNFQTKKLKNKTINRDIDKEKIKNNFRKNIESMVSISKIYGSQPILMTQMSRIKEELDEDIILEIRNQLPHLGVKYDEYYLLFKAFNEIIRDIANEYNVPLVDLDRTIKKDRKYMYDVIHLTEEGSKMVAKNILELLDKY